MTEQGLETTSFESLLEELVGKGILVDPYLLWWGPESQPDGDAGRIDHSIGRRPGGNKAWQVDTRSQK